MAQPPAAAAAAAAVVIDPLDEVKDALVICGFGNNANRFILCQGVIDISTFELVPYDKGEDIAKMHKGHWKRPEQKIGYPV